MKRFVSSLCVLFLPGIAMFCQGEQPKPHRPDADIEKVVADGIKEEKSLDWARYADLVHPDSLKEYKDMWLPVLKVATRERPDKQADLLAAFDKATDLKAVIALKPREFFISSMKGMASQLPQLNAGRPADVQKKILGTVHEGSDMAHVLVRSRTKLDESDVTRVEVVTLKRTGAGWKLLLPDVVRVMAETYRRAALATQKAGPVKDRADPDK